MQVEDAEGQVNGQYVVRQVVPGEPAGGSQCRAWLFTINNPSSSDLPSHWSPAPVYCVWQLERGVEGTPHLQGYLVLSSPRRLSYLKKFDQTAHWEPRRGNHSQAKDYCTKEDTRVEGPWTFGDEPVGQGKRNDLESVKRQVDSGASDLELFESNFTAMVKFTRGIREYKRLRMSPRSWKTEVHVYWGKTDIGKSHTVRELAPAAFWKRRSKGGGEWWDGYDGQSDVVIDEFYGWITWDMVLRLFDEYPLSVDTKGGAVEFVARRIFVTSNAHPKNWYRIGGHMELPTLFRRITSCQTRSDRTVDWVREDLLEPDSLAVPAIIDDTVSSASTYRNGSESGWDSIPAWQC